MRVIEVVVDVVVEVERVSVRAPALVRTKSHRASDDDDDADDDDGDDDDDYNDDDDSVDVASAALYNQC